jgi:putative membrane protein
MQLADLPTLNAILNFTATILLVAGWICIRNRKVAAHIAFMVLALLVSAGFLTSYLIYHFNTEPFRFPVAIWNWVRIGYFVLLVTHILAAIVNLPMVIMTVIPAARRKFDKHKRIARWTLPMWLYVSVTGVMVYIMCYQITYPKEMTQRPETQKVLNSSSAK